MLLLKICIGFTWLHIWIAKLECVLLLFAWSSNLVFQIFFDLDSSSSFWSLCFPSLFVAGTIYWWFIVSAARPLFIFFEFILLILLLLYLRLRFCFEYIKLNLLLRLSLFVFSLVLSKLWDWNSKLWISGSFIIIKLYIFLAWTIHLGHWVQIAAVIFNNFDFLFTLSLWIQFLQIWIFFL